MKKTTAKEKKDIVVTFRLSFSEFQPFQEIIKKTGINKSKLMRNVVIAKTENIVLPKESSVDIKRILFLANKTSNNINQIAKRINYDYMIGKLDDKKYKTILNNLINIERSFFYAIDKC